MDISEQTRLHDQIDAIQKEIRETPYHKGTEHHIGKLRARIARLKDKMIEYQGKGKGGGKGYAVKQQGDATVVLIGPPSAGKSTLINRFTNAQSKIAPYDFTTVSVIPGMMIYKNARIQILDVPGLIQGAEEGKGRGREVLSVARSSDLLIIMTDIKRLEALKNIENALERNGIRVNQKPPKVDIEKKFSGGMIIHSNFKQDYDNETIKSAAGEFGYKNSEITIKEHLSLDRLIDSFSSNRVYIPAIFIVNKSDLLEDRSMDISDTYVSYNDISYISAEKNINLENLKETIWDKLNFIRVYLIKEDQEPSFKDPIIVKKGFTLKDVSELIGTDFSERRRKAIIWGTGSKFKGQEVSLTTEVQEGMQVRFI